ncbi:MAG: metal ABC transporter substrate-binding protein [Anaerolineales bacterium]
MKTVRLLFGFLLIAVWGLVACAPVRAGGGQAQGAIRVLAVETFLADIAQNVAGDRIKVESLMPIGVDPHAFNPTPQDVRKVAESDVLILNGAGFEEFAQKMLENAGGERLVIEAAAGLTMRTREAEHDESGGEHLHAGDPHFWLDPLSVVKYVENIRDGLIAADPAGREVYTQNAAAYIAQLNDLHAWIETQVAQIPPERRVLVTDHDTLGYFADRYGFTVLGAIIPNVSSGASPTAQEMAQLIDQVKSSGAPAIFVESISSPQLANQVAAETGAKVVTDLYTHSITAPDGKAPTYITMMRHNVETMVAALK